MECSKIQEMILSDYSDGVASLALRADVEAHVRDCASCREILVAVQANDAMLKSAPRPEPPAYLWEAVREDITYCPPTIWDRLADIVQGWAPVPRPALTAALTVVTIAIMSTLLWRPETYLPAVSPKEGRDQIKIIALLGDSGELTQEFDDVGSTVAEYLL